MRMPGRPDIAGDLIAWVEAAGATWRAPGHEREAASEGVVQAARHAVVADAQALRRIVARLGCWPGRTLVGDAGCRAALAIALNTDHDPAFQVTLLKMLAEAVRRGDAAAAQWAHLRDRCLVGSGRPQQYGTQYWLCDGRLVMYTAAAPENLDKRRASVGLPPRHDQLTALERRHLPTQGPAEVTSERPAA
ncbi:DUF6624 domain-containing protein [Streptomyces sp. NPDC006510]|uniref:DUF6624 domain-containing protein n=1 Tax=Streptomyces sp. NPDC006510 TaxID=3155600 RepID=UPI0033BBACA6